MRAFPGKYLSVTTYRRDGTPVATPVWFVEEEGRLLVDTAADSYKVERIRRNPSVLIAPCTPMGRLRGEQVDGRAEIVGADALGHMRRLMRRKYRIESIFLLPPYHAYLALKRRGAPAGESVVVAITPGQPQP